VDHGSLNLRTTRYLPDAGATSGVDWWPGSRQVVSTCSGLIKGVDAEGYDPLILITISPILPSDSE
jgi:hypothetical protein